MPTATPVSSKSRRIAVLLAIPCLLGCLGAHRFYLGKYITASIMLVLSILGLAFFSANLLGFLPLLVAVLWALVDFVMLILGAVHDRAGLPVKKW
jgi:TM2 domain-containing membrane protein YozV